MTTEPIYTDAQLSPLYVALMNARDAYLASAKQFPKPKDRATLRKQCLLISNHMAQLLSERQASMQGQGEEVPSELDELRLRFVEVCEERDHLNGLLFGAAIQPPQPVRSVSDEPNGSYLAHITANQAQNLLDYFGGESTTYVLIRCKEDEVAPDDDGTPMPAGLYVYDANCPEEGVIYLGDEDEESRPTDLADQPSAVPDGIGAEELAEFAKTVADFNACEETETPYHTLTRWAEMGLLECERFNITAKGQEVIAAIAQEKQS